MDTNLEHEEELLAGQRRWTQGWRRFVAPTVFLVYLLYVADAVAQNEAGAAEIAGFAILAAFAVGYLAIVRESPGASTRRFWILYAILVALLVAELPFAHAAGFVMALYITAISVSRLGVRACRSCSRWRWRRCWCRSRSAPGTTT